MRLAASGDNDLALNLTLSHIPQWRYELSRRMTKSRVAAYQDYVALANRAGRSGWNG